MRRVGLSIGESPEPHGGWTKMCIRELVRGTKIDFEERLREAKAKAESGCPAFRNRAKNYGIVSNYGTVVHFH